MTNGKGNNSESINVLLHKGRGALAEAVSAFEFLKEEQHKLLVQDRESLRQEIEKNY